MDTHNNDQEKVIEEDDNDGGWVDTHHYDTSHSDIAEQVSEMNLDGVCHRYTPNMPSLISVDNRM